MNPFYFITLHRSNQMGSQYNPLEQEDLLLEEEVSKENQLILYNDDVNTFDWVIESLIAICRHDRNQAEQCSIIIHNNGKCSVKEGQFEKLRPMCEALLDRGLSATIE
ncbi:MAG: ATP-dependent Clp protease adaptor ClpS [Bacteroidia bacterium]